MKVTAENFGRLPDERYRFGRILGKGHLHILKERVDEMKERYIPAKDWSRFGRYIDYRVMYIATYCEKRVKVGDRVYRRPYKMKRCKQCIEAEKEHALNSLAGM
jgi:hypothetical protein